jgi:uncharacterized glyoxalase superfamily protein PhnB
MTNRSVPTDTLLPHVVYSDVAAAVDWLARTFGFVEHYRYGEPGGGVSGAQVHLGNAYLMLGRAGENGATPARCGQRTQMLTVFVDDVDAHFARTKSAGARIVEEPHETCYGERQYGVEDFEGHRWLFSQHVRDLNPEEWGATLANPPR